MITVDTIGKVRRAYFVQKRTIKAIARDLRLARNTVRDYVRAGSFPESRRRVPRRSTLTPFKEYLRRRFHEGCTNAARLWEEVRGRGYAGSHCTVQRFIAGLRARLPPEIRERLQRHTSGRAPRAQLPAALGRSPREVVWLLLRRPTELKAEERQLLEELFAASPDLTTDLTTAYVFADVDQAWRTTTGRPDVSRMTSMRTPVTGAVSARSEPAISRSSARSTASSARRS
jgi:PAS domain-containing protein